MTKWHLYNVNEEFFDVSLEGITELQAWFLGIMGADGYVADNGNLFSIGQSKYYGLALIAQIKKMLAFTGPIQHYLPKLTTHKHHTIQISSKALVACLNKLGIHSKKSLTFEFPTCISTNLIRPFLRGYVDGDGSIGVYDNGKGCKYLCISLVGTSKFIERCVEVIPIKGNVTHIKRVKNCYELRFNGINAIDFGKWLWNAEIDREFTCTRNMQLKDTGEPLYIKQKRFMKYLDSDAYKTLVEKQKHKLATNQTVRDMLDSGIPAMDVSRALGLAFQSVYRIKGKYA